MSDHEYVPSSKFGKWFNDRLPLLTLASHLTDYPTPKNLNYWWTFGGILTSNQVIDIKVAEEINKLFFEVLIAPNYSDSALDLLKSKQFLIF